MSTPWIEQTHVWRQTIPAKGDWRFLIPRGGIVTTISITVPAQNQNGFHPGRVPRAFCNSCGCFNYSLAPTCSQCGAPLPPIEFIDAGLSSLNPSVTTLARVELEHSSGVRLFTDVYPFAGADEITATLDTSTLIYFLARRFSDGMGLDTRYLVSSTLSMLSTCPAPIDISIGLGIRVPLMP